MNFNDPFTQRFEQRNQNDQPDQQSLNIEQGQQFQEQPQDPFSVRESERKKLQELQDEELDPEIERHIARYTSRGLERIAGLPGDIRDLAYSVKELYKENGLAPNIKGAGKLKLPELSEPEAFKKFEEALPVAQTVSTLLDYLPTSTRLKKFSEEKSGGYTSPQGEVERIGDEVWENLVSSALPGQGPRNVWRNIAAPIAGVIGKEAVKYIGGSDKEQAMTQLGLNIALPLMAGNAPQLNRQTWQNVRQNVPQVSIPTNQMLTRAQDVRRRIQEGLGSRSESQALTTVNNLIEKLERGQISANELMASNISLNEIVGDPELFGRGGHWFEEVRDIIRDGMGQVGQQAPDWYREWQRANEIHGAIANSNYIANFIQKRTEPLVNEGARALFQAAAHGTGKVAATLPPIYAIYKGTQVLNRMASSPELMRYYTGVLTNALRGNAAMTASNLKKLDEALEKQDKQRKPPFKASTTKK